MIKNKFRILAVAGLIFNIQCFCLFWNRNDNRQGDHQFPENDSMNQHLIFNIHCNPTQIKAPPSLPESFFSNLHLQELQNCTTNFLYQQRYLLGISLIAGGFAYACHLVVKANRYLENPETWASWRQDMPYELLVTIPQQEIAKDLVLEVQRRYSNPQNPTDFLSPLISFIHAIDDEITMMKRINFAYIWITKLYLGYILPINEKLYCKVEEKLKKLIHLKQVFLAWVAEYKVNHNKNGSTRFKPAFSQKK